MPAIRLPMVVESPAPIASNNGIHIQISYAHPYTINYFTPPLPGERWG
jgi:hypothetical protein